MVKNYRRDGVTYKDKTSKDYTGDLEYITPRTSSLGLFRIITIFYLSIILQLFEGKYTGKFSKENKRHCSSERKMFQRILRNPLFRKAKVTQHSHLVVIV